MQFRSIGRPGWIAAWALVSLAVAGCSSSDDSASDAPKAPSGTTAASSAAPSPAQARPDDACTLLTSDQVENAVGVAGPFKGMPLGKTSTGGTVWGCTWGTPQSSVSLQELDAKTYTDSKSNAKPTAVSGVGEEAFIDSRQNGGMPALYFELASHHYRLDVQADRTTANPNTAKDAAIEEALAKTLAKAIAG